MIRTLLIGAALLFFGCAGHDTEPEAAETPSEQTTRTFETLCKTPQDLTLAVTTVDLSNKTARLVYDEQGIRTLLTLALQQSNCYRIIDWNRLKEVIDQHQLQWAQLQGGTDDARVRLNDLLAADYFVQIGVNNYSKETDFSTSTLSKEKTTQVRVGVDLMLKNALTNAQSKAFGRQGEAVQHTEQNTVDVFGARAGTSHRLDNDALHDAIQSAVRAMAQTPLARVKRTGHKRSALADLDLQNIETSLQSLLTKTPCSGQWRDASGTADTTFGITKAKKFALMRAYADASAHSGSQVLRSLSDAFHGMTDNTQGFVSRYDLKQLDWNGEAYQADIRACVCRGTTDSAEGLRGLKTFVTLIGEPTLLVVLQQTQNASGATLRTAEVTMGQYFGALGYRVLLSDDLQGRGIADETRVLRAREGSSGHAIELARDAGADYLIVGSLTLDSTQQSIADASGHLSATSFNARAIAPGSGNASRLFSKQHSTMDLADRGIVNRELHLKRVALEMAHEIAWQMPVYLLSEAREIELVLDDVSYRTYRDLVQNLEREPEISAVIPAAKWRAEGERGTTRLIIRTSYLGVTSDALIDLLGSYGMTPKVEQIGTYHAHLRLGE